MTDTLILGLRENPQLLQIFVDNLPATFDYAKFFPLTSNITFKWETLKKAVEGYASKEKGKDSKPY